MTKTEKELTPNNLDTIAGKIRFTSEILWVVFIIHRVYQSISTKMVGTEVTFLEYYAPIIGIYFLITLIPLSAGLLKNIVFEKLKLGYSKEKYIVEIKSVFITGIKFSGTLALITLIDWFVKNF